MANLFMTIEEWHGKFLGSAKVKIDGDKQGIKADTKWFPIESADTTSIHDISMSPGSQSNRDSGQIGLQPFKITKSFDGVSGILRSLLFQPGDDGFTVYIVQVETAQDPTKGSQVTHYIKLLNARLSTFKTTLVNDQIPAEEFTVTFSEITEESWHDVVGAEDPESCGPVTYDLNTTSLSAYVKL